MSLLLRAPRPRHGTRQESTLEWMGSNVNETIIVAQQLSSQDVVIKPKELHLAFDWGVLRSRGYSRFRPLKLSQSRPKFTGKGPLRDAGNVSRSSTMCSTRTFSMTLCTDVSILVTRPVRRESTYIVWGAILAAESPSANVALRNVLVKIAVDEEGGEDLREDALMHEHLRERGLTLGYYGIFVDSIGSTALVIDDFDGELGEVQSPAPSL